MPLLTPLRAVTGFSAANLHKATPIRFKGNLVDEVGKEDREMLRQIDHFAQSKPLSKQQKQSYEAYIDQYHDLNENLQQGVDKQAVIGLLKRRMTEMWKTFTEPKTQQAPVPKPMREYRPSKLSQVYSAVPETIEEES